MKFARNVDRTAVDVGSDVCRPRLANRSLTIQFPSYIWDPELVLGVPNIARDSPKSRLGLTQFPIAVLPKSRLWSYPNPDRVAPNSRLTTTQFPKAPDRFSPEPVQEIFWRDSAASVSCLEHLMRRRRREEAVRKPRRDTTTPRDHATTARGAVRTSGSHNAWPRRDDTTRHHTTPRRDATTRRHDAAQIRLSNTCLT